MGTSQKYEVNTNPHYVLFETWEQSHLISLICENRIGIF